MDERISLTKGKEVGVGVPNFKMISKLILAIVVGLIEPPIIRSLLNHSQMFSPTNFMLERGVSWLSKLQIVVALSTVEVEYMTTTKACKKAIWIQSLMEELRHKQQKIIVYCDNQNSLLIARNPTIHSRIKPIGVQ